jgi:L-lactate permease
MMSKQQVWKIVLPIAGLCVIAALMYFFYGKQSPPIISGLIVVAVLLFVRLLRKSQAYQDGPRVQRQAAASSRKPVRDFALACACFVATVVITLLFLTGIDHNVLPDNKVTVGILFVVIFAGIGGVMFFMSGIIGRVISGPPPPET